jgi:hypothetical protein
MQDARQTVHRLGHDFQHTYLCTVQSSNPSNSVGGGVHQGGDVCGHKDEVVEHDGPEKAWLHGVIAQHHCNAVVKEVGCADGCYVRVNWSEQERPVAKLL